MTRAADDPIVRAEIHDALTACGLDPVTEGAIDGVIAIAGAGTHSYSDAAQVAAAAVTQFDLKSSDVPHLARLLAAGQKRTWSEDLTQGDGIITRSDHARLTGQVDTTLDGATTPGEPSTWPANAGEYAARWNAHDTQWREDHVSRRVDTAERASRCIDLDHEGKIGYLQNAWDQSTEAWHKVHQHPKVAALSHLPIPLYQQVLQALDQPHEDTALARDYAPWVDPQSGDRADHKIGADWVHSPRAEFPPDTRPADERTTPSDPMEEMHLEAVLRAVTAEGRISRALAAFERQQTVNGVTDQGWMSPDEWLLGEVHAALGGADADGQGADRG